MSGAAAVRRKDDVYAGAEVRSRLGTVSYHTDRRAVQGNPRHGTHRDQVAKNLIRLLLTERNSLTGKGTRVCVSYMYRKRV